MTEPIRIELPTFFDADTVNSWLFLEPEPVLIDCGEKTEKSWQALQEGLKKQGLKISDVSKVIITHGHIDHIGMANKITEHSDATIYVSEYNYEWAVDLKGALDKRTKTIRKVMDVNDPTVGEDFSFGYKMLSPYWDEIPEHRLEVFSMNGILNFGGQDWEIIYAPGHCINQTCFYQKETKQFLSADALLKIFPIPIIDYGVKAPFSRTKSVLETLETFEMLKKMDLGKVYPGHWGIIENPNQLIDSQIKRVEKKIEKTYDLIKSGIADFPTLINCVYPNRYNPATMFMVLGFLDILIEQGRVGAVENNGQLLYFKN